MSKNEIVISPKMSLTKWSRHNNTECVAVVNYEPYKPGYYSFSYSFDQDISIKMTESYKSTTETDFEDATYDECVLENEKFYYSLAAASGIITSSISSLNLGEKLQNIEDSDNKKDLKPIIIKIAKLLGYKKSDIAGASNYIVNNTLSEIQQDSKGKELLIALSEHPSIAGLIFSIISQYSGKSHVLSNSGKISSKELPKHYCIGESHYEKIMCGFYYWMFSIIASGAAKRMESSKKVGIPQKLLKLFVEVSDSEIAKKIPLNYAAAEEEFSSWLLILINGVHSASKNREESSENNRWDNLINLVSDLSKDAFPVLINEGIVRSVYILLNAYSTIKKCECRSIKELKSIPASDLISGDERILSNMLLISSACFAGVNVAEATLKAIKDKKVDKRKFTQAFISEINIIGLGRFVFACIENVQYRNDNIQILLQRIFKQNKQANNNEQVEYDAHSFDSLSLDALQARMLYCLENFAVQNDIKRTSKPEIAERKQHWLDEWKMNILRNVGCPESYHEEYFVKDEDIIYNAIFEQAKDKSNWRWFYLLSEELALFVPYVPLGHKDDNQFKKLKMDHDYVKDQFVRRQTIVSQNEVDSIIKAYTKYKGYISGSTQNKIIGAGVTTVTAIATGGMALTFAPGIAAAIAGEAVAGLHGAALTSASLAFVGGGSLAAGGLGMAGGTAIITGGGALLGLAGSGTVSAATALLQTPSEYWVRQSSKLLTYCKCVLCDYLNDKKAVLGISHQIDYSIANIEEQIQDLKNEKNDLNAEIIKKESEYLKYLKKCNAELKKIVR